MKEVVSATPRRAMTPARRKRIWEAAGGKCFVCSKLVPEAWTTLDHEIQLWLGGADSDENLRPLCGPCDRIKTAADATKRAKVKRIIRQADPETRKPSRMQSRGFQTDLTKGFDGKVRPRKKSR